MLGLPQLCRASGCTSMVPPAAKGGSFEKPPPLESPAKLFIKVCLGPVSFAYLRVSSRFKKFDGELWIAASIDFP